MKFSSLHCVTLGCKAHVLLIIVTVKFKSSRPEVFCKKMFLEISQNSQENTRARVSFLVKLQARSAALLKKILWHRCFPVNFAKFLRKHFLTEHLWWLLLKVYSKVPLAYCINSLLLIHFQQKNLNLNTW